MNRRLWLLTVVIASLCSVPAVAQPGDAITPDTPDDARPIELFRSILRPGDSILWIGGTPLAASEIARYTSAALLMARPADDLRPYTIAIDGASPEDAHDAAHRAMLTLQPTVVVMCFGLSDEQLTRDPDPDRAAEYGNQIAALIEFVRKRGAREVLVVSPAPLRASKFFEGVNEQVKLLAAAAAKAASEHDAVYLDLFDSMREDLEDRPAHASDPQRLDEADSLISACHLLIQLGFTERAFLRTAFKPCPADVFENARARLPVDYQPDPRRAQNSFELAQALAEHERGLSVIEFLNERLPPAHPLRTQMLAMQRTELERNWQETRMLLRSFSAAP